jgi:hypothetical protein
MDTYELAELCALKEREPIIEHKSCFEDSPCTKWESGFCQLHTVSHGIISKLPWILSHFCKKIILTLGIITTSYVSNCMQQIDGSQSKLSTKSAMSSTKCIICSAHQSKMTTNDRTGPKSIHSAIKRLIPVSRRLITFTVCSILVDRVDEHVSRRRIRHNSSSP